METRELSKEELIGLIAEFKSEVRKNLTKIDFFNEKIDELTKMLGMMPESIKVEDKKTGTRKPYPLSTWDKIIIDVIKENGRPTTSKEIYDNAMAKATEMGVAMEESKMKSKINQCLVKLSSRRHDIKKVKYQGRGFAYTLAE
jgi:hypothetical protein